MNSSSEFSADQLQRYARHLTLPEFGLEGQRKLGSSRVLLVGAGGLGSPAALYLASAGVGTLGIVDDDLVDLSNLQRQILHGTASIGAPKVASAMARLDDLNPEIEVIPHQVRLSSENAREIINGYDLVIDGSDNFPTRYLVNDSCVMERVPFVYGSIYRFEGQLSLFATPNGPCYRCLFAEPPAPELVPSCAEAGVLGVLPGIIGSLQALEAIKWLAGMGDTAVGRLLLFDALSLRLREIALKRDPDCAVCGDRPSITELIDYQRFCGVSSSSRGDDDVMDITAKKVFALLENGPEPFLLDVREPWEFEMAHIDGSILVPLSQLAGAVGQLPTDREIVTICHHGVRSVSAAKFLRSAGFDGVRSLCGGVDAWAVSIDAGMRRY